MVTGPSDTKRPGEDEAPWDAATLKEGKEVMAYESNAATNAGLIEVQIEYRAVAELILDSKNPRQHSQRQINQLGDSIREFGFVMPVVVDGRGQVIVGHGRVLAAKKLRHSTSISVCGVWGARPRFKSLGRSFTHVYT